MILRRRVVFAQLGLLFAQPRRLWRRWRREGSFWRPFPSVYRRLERGSSPHSLAANATKPVAAMQTKHIISIGIGIGISSIASTIGCTRRGRISSGGGNPRLKRSPANVCPRPAFNGQPFAASSTTALRVFCVRICQHCKRICCLDFAVDLVVWSSCFPIWRKYSIHWRRGPAWPVQVFHQLILSNLWH